MSYRLAGRKVDRGLRRWTGGRVRRFLAVMLVSSLACAIGAGEGEAKKKKDAGEESLAPLFYPPLPQEPRFQFLGSVSSSRQFRRKAGLSGFLFGTERGSVDIERPHGIALHRGKLYVCDPGAHAAWTFDIVEGEVSSFNVDHPQHVLRTPISVSVGDGGRKYVTDPRAGKLLALDAEDRPIWMSTAGSRVVLGSSVPPPGDSDECAVPTMQPAAAVEHAGELFVADLASSTIKVFDPANGCLIREFGEEGRGEGQFLKPTNLAVGPQGHLYVSDMINARVQKVDRSGAFIRSFGGLGTGLGKMVRPKGVAVDRAGRVYVVDAATQVVQVFDAEGRLLLPLGQPGTDRGGLSLPAGIAIADDEEALAYGSQLAAPGFEVQYLVLVSNHLGANKINMYGFGRYTAPGRSGGSR